MTNENIVYTDFGKIPEDEQLLIRKAEEATNNAYAPYSSFHVGAAILLDDDSIITGSNQENAAFPSGLCAERVAIFSIMNMYPNKKIKKIAVTARKKMADTYLPAAPCGGCRQVMLEQEVKQKNAIEVLFKTNDSWVKITSVSHLLPFSFNKNALK